MSADALVYPCWFGTGKVTQHVVLIEKLSKYGIAFFILIWVLNI